MRQRNDKRLILCITQSWLKNGTFLPLRTPSSERFFPNAESVACPFCCTLSQFVPLHFYPLNLRAVIRRQNLCADRELPRKEPSQPTSGMLVLLHVAPPILQGI